MQGDTEKSERRRKGKRRKTTIWLRGICTLGEIESERK